MAEGYTFSITRAPERHEAYFGGLGHLECGGRGGKSVSLQLFMGQRGKTGDQDAVDGALNTHRAQAHRTATGG